MDTRNIHRGGRAAYGAVINEAGKNAVCWRNHIYDYGFAGWALAVVVFPCGDRVGRISSRFFVMRDTRAKTKVRVNQNDDLSGPTRMALP